MMLTTLIAANVMAATPPPAAEPVGLAFLSGDWTIHDAEGDRLGLATISIPD